MYRKLALGSKVLGGYMILVGFVALTGLVGYLGILNVARSLQIVGDEEAPVVDMAMEMKVSLLEGRNAMEEYKSATSAIATDDASKLDAIYKNRVPHDPSDLDQARTLAEQHDDVMRLGVFYRNEDIPSYDEVRAIPNLTTTERMARLNQEFDRYAV